MPAKETVRVRYRRARREDGDVVAHFVDFDADPQGNATVYQHIGQHGAASRDWLARSTRKATPAEYAELHAELTRVYSDCTLVVQQNARRKRSR